MGEVQATAAPGTDATKTEPKTVEEHADVVQASQPCQPCQPRGAHLRLLVDVVGGNDEDVVGAHVWLCGGRTGVDAGGQAPVDGSGAVAVRGQRGGRRGATPKGTAVAACVAEAGEVVLQDETGDEAGDGV